MGLDLELPPPFKKFSNLAFNHIARQQESNTTTFRPREMHELGCMNQAIATYSVKVLKKKKVVVEIHPPFKVMESKMSITIRALKAGGVELVATLNVTEDKLTEMKRGAINVPM